MIQGVDREATVSVEVELGVGTPEAHKLSGPFTFRRMTLRDRARIAGVVSELADGRPIADPDLRIQVWMMAELSVCIVRDEKGVAKCPDWFPLDFDKQDDPTLLSLVYGRYAAWRATFRGGAGSGPGAAAPAAG